MRNSGRPEAPPNRPSFNRVRNRIDLQRFRSQQGTNNNIYHIQNPSNNAWKCVQTFLRTKPTKQKKRKPERLKLIPEEVSSIQLPWSLVPVARGLATRSPSKSQRVRGGWTASTVRVLHPPLALPFVMDKHADTSTSVACLAMARGNTMRGKIATPTVESEPKVK